MPNDLVTAFLPRELQFRRWAEEINRRFDTPLQFQVPQRHAGLFFDGEVRTRPLGSLTIGRVTSGVGYRALMKGNRHGEPYFLFNFLTAGEAVIRQDGRESRFGADEFALFANTRDVDWLFPHNFGEYVLKIPKRTLYGYYPQCEDLTALRFPRTPVSQMLLSLMATYVRESGDDPTPGAARLEDAFLEMLVSSLMKALGKPKETSPRRSVLYYEAQRIIRDQMSDTDLTPQQIADELRVSLRTLQTIFQENGKTVMDAIWHLRLENARRQLVDPALACRSVSEIGYENGFKTPAHFSKRFREAYGCTPREHRLGHIEEAGQLLALA